MIKNSAQPLWRKVAYHFNNYGPPLRPCEEDICIMEKAVAKWANRYPDQKFRAALWGVTPEIAGMSWPEGTELLAFEKSEEMIREVWPGDIDGFRKARCCNWLDTFSVIKNPVSTVIGDCCFNLHRFPGDWRALFVAAYRVLKEQGVFIMRFFMRSGNRESSGNVFKELMENKIKNLHLFKLRLIMSLQEDVRQGVRHHDIWQAWKNASIDMAKLIKVTGWTKELISIMELFEGINTRVSYPTHMELKPIFSDIFKEIDMTIPEYEKGECCPIMVFRKRMRNGS
ncbi:hypothetical protein ACFL1N_10405 [Thermodesulfobacteriota bacterium]